MLVFFAKISPFESTWLPETLFSGCLKMDTHIMSSEQKFTEETVLWLKKHSPKHLTFAITRPEHFRFSAGQFARLGFRVGEHGYIWRAYSVTSAEYDDTLVFFVILIENGEISAHFAQLQAGDTILLDKTAQGFFLPQRFPDGRDLIIVINGFGHCAVFVYAAPA